MKQPLLQWIIDTGSSRTGWVLAKELRSFLNDERAHFERTKIMGAPTPTLMATHPDWPAMRAQIDSAIEAAGKIADIMGGKVTASCSGYYCPDQDDGVEQQVRVFVDFAAMPRNYVEPKAERPVEMPGISADVLPGAPPKE